MVVIVIPLQSEWSRHLMDRSTLNLLMMYLLMDLHNRKNVFLYYLQKISPENILSVKRRPLFGDGLGDRIFLIWIRLNIFSRKICWLWNSVLQYLKHFHPEVWMTFMFCFYTYLWTVQIQKCWGTSALPVLFWGSRKNSLVLGSSSKDVENGGQISFLVSWSLFAHLHHYICFRAHLSLLGQP